MPVSTEIKPELDLTIFTATGIVPFSEQMKILRSFYHGSPTRNVIWDFTQAEEVKISSTELQTIVQYTKAHSAQRPGGRTALVVDTKFKYGLGRMASTFAEIEATPWDMEVFDHLDQAMAWISGSTGVSLLVLTVTGRRHCCVYRLKRLSGKRWPTQNVSGD